MCFFFKYVKTFIFFLACSLHLNTFCQCVAAGPNAATSSVNNTGVGTIGWSNMTGIYVADNIYTSAGALLGVLSSAQTNYLVATDFGFSIPATATICGIQVDVTRNASGLLIGSSIKDNSVYIVKGGTITGANHASATAWPGSNGNMTYGSNADLWGTTFTPAQINAANFGVALSANLNAGLASLFLTANIDQVTITVYYNNGTLPIEVASLSATAENKEIRIDWATASEVNSSYFSVEKMDPEGTWSGITTVKAAGTSTTLKHYAAYDQAPGEINYYHVKQVDLDHQESFSKIIAISYSKARETAIHVYPVPASSDLHIGVKNNIEKVELVSVAGQLLLQDLPSQKDLTIDISTLPSGVYVLKVYTQYDTLEQKFIRE